jgi:signal transduction histidine kinase
MLKHKILIIDDEIENLNLLRRTFIRDYIVLIASTATDAFDLLSKNRGVSVVISDQRMPEMTGTEIFKKIAAEYPDIIKILLTAYTDIESLVEAINEGKVYKYLAKPWDAEELKLTVMRASELFDLSAENKQLLKDLAQKNVELRKMKDYSEERVEEERLRISRELHDDTCQALASQTLSMELCIRMLKPDLNQEKIDSIKDNIITMREQIKDISRQVRRISMDLRPAELDSLGFVSTIEQFINRFSKQENIPEIQLNLSGDIITLPQRLELAMFRLIQECLNNIKKHSEASNVFINLEFGDEKLTIIVKDNGKGFELPENYSELLQDGHLGLVGMKERVENFNGELKINSSPGNGTEIKVVVSPSKEMF